MLRRERQTSMTAATWIAATIRSIRRLALRYRIADEAVLSLRRHVWKSPAVLRLGLIHANPDACPDASDELPGTINYFTSDGPITGIPTYGKIRYDAVYPGIDLVYYGNQRQLE